MFKEHSLREPMSKTNNYYGNLENEALSKDTIIPWFWLREKLKLRIAEIPIILYIYYIIYKIYNIIYNILIYNIYTNILYIYIQTGQKKKVIFFWPQKKCWP